MDEIFQKSKAKEAQDDFKQNLTLYLNRELIEKKLKAQEKAQRKIAEEAHHRNHRKKYTS